MKIAEFQFYIRLNSTRQRVHARSKILFVYDGRLCVSNRATTDSRRAKFMDSQLSQRGESVPELFFFIKSWHIWLEAKRKHSKVFWSFCYWGFYAR